MHPSFFLLCVLSNIYVHIDTRTSIWSMSMCVWMVSFFFSLRRPMIAREGRKISRTYIFSISPLVHLSESMTKWAIVLRGHCMHILMINAIRWQEKRERERRGEKKKPRDKLRASEATYAYLDLSNQRNVLIGWTEKKSTNERKRVTRLNFFLLSLPLSLSLLLDAYVRSEWPENIIIPSNDNASGAKTTTQTAREREKKSERGRGIFLSLSFFLIFSLLSFVFINDRKKLFPPNKSL